MTLHLSHIFFTDGRTFIPISLVSIGDAPTRQVVRGELHLHLVAGSDADVVHSHLPGDVSKHLVPVLQLDTEHGVRQRLDHRSFDQDRVILGLGQRASPSGLEARRQTYEFRATDGAPNGQGADRRDYLMGPDIAKLPDRRQATVRTVGPSSVIATVCSKCAAREPSAVTTVHPSARVRVAGRPTVTIGS